MSIDTAVNLFIGQLQNYSLTSLSVFWDFIFEPVLLVVVSLIISIYLFFIKRKKEASVFFSSMLAIGAVVEFLKFLMMRARPLNQIILRTDFAFPSGHAAVNLVFFGMLVYIFLGSRSLRTKTISYILAGILVLFIGFTRIYLRVHWLTDVLVGFVVGAVVLSVGIIVLRKINN